MPLRETCANTEFFLVRTFLYSDWIRRFKELISVFSPNIGKYGPGKAPYLDTFHAVHIKPALLKQILQALNKEEAWFSNTCAVLLWVSNEKNKTAVFASLQIQKLIKDEKFLLSIT